MKIYIYIIPRSFGALYQTVTGADGTYSYQVPEGVYLVLAEIYPDDDEPEIGDYLEPIGEDGSITVPPSQVIDFGCRSAAVTRLLLSSRLAIDGKSTSTSLASVMPPRLKAYQQERSERRVQ